MPKYLCVQRSLPVESSGESNPDKPSPTQMQEMFAQFNAWKEKFADNIVDMGGKLGQGKLVTTDGPIVEAKELIGGFMILQAESLDEAIEVARGVPGLVRPGSGVEVREIKTP